MQLNPVIISVEQTAQDEITVEFSKNMIENSALTNAGNYTVYDMNSEVVTGITAVEVVPNTYNKVVVLTIEENNFIYEDDYYVWVNPYDGPTCIDGLPVGVISGELFGAFEEYNEIDPADFDGVSLGLLDTSSMPSECCIGITADFQGEGTPRLTVVDLETNLDVPDFTNVPFGNGTSFHRIQLDPDKEYDIYINVDEYDSSTELTINAVYLTTIEGNYNLFSGVPIPAIENVYMEKVDEFPNPILVVVFNVRINRNTVNYEDMELQERGSFQGVVTANITPITYPQHIQEFKFTTTRLTHNGSYDVVMDHTAISTELGWSIDPQNVIALLHSQGHPLNFTVFADSRNSLIVKFDFDININDNVRNTSTYEFSNDLRCIGVEVLDTKTIRLLTTEQVIDKPYTLKIRKGD